MGGRRFGRAELISCWPAGRGHGGTDRGSKSGDWTTEEELQKDAERMLKETEEGRGGGGAAEKVRKRGIE